MSPAEQSVHELKVWPEYFGHLESGAKPFEIRRFDREYKEGDILLLREFAPNDLGEHPTGHFTGKKVRRRITYMTTFAQRPGYVVMGLSHV